MSVTNVRKLSSLLDISQRLSSALDFRTALIQVLELLEENHGAVAGTVTLLDEQTGELRIEAATGISWQAQRRAKFKIGEGVTGRVVESGRPVVVPRVSQE
ncbi:MAG: AAA family ATPase, partial [Gemmatimonadetes bacterium]|nr:AAA family ATPase [Gemmatimonadota bacterium]